MVRTEWGISGPNRSGGNSSSSTSRTSRLSLCSGVSDGVDPLGLSNSITLGEVITSDREDGLESGENSPRVSIVETNGTGVSARSSIETALGNKNSSISDIRRDSAGSVGATPGKNYKDSHSENSKPVKFESQDSLPSPVTLLASVQSGPLVTLSLPSQTPIS